MTNNPTLQNLKCPDCQGRMVPRANKKDGSKFWGCSQFPKCKGSRDSMGLSKAEREAERNEFNGQEEEQQPKPSRRYD